MRHSKAHLLVNLVRRLIKYRGFTVKELTRRCQLGPAYFNQIRKAGSMQISDYFIVCEALSVNPYVLLAMVDKSTAGSLDGIEAQEIEALKEELLAIKIRGESHVNR